VRIISGIAGGRKLKTPEGRDIRPTSDKVRGAIFNSLRSRGAVKDAVVIDVFCGSGALGLEALSQGAAHCTFIDNNKTSLALAKENAEQLSLDKNAAFVFAYAEKLKPHTGAKFTLAFLDPPYNKSLVLRALDKLDAGGWLAGDAICVVEVEKNFRDIIPPPFHVLDEKLYGDTKILFLKYSS
jgi:16S rRNA (guanine966-N2)-methyltransferase